MNGCFVVLPRLRLKLLAAEIELLESNDAKKSKDDDDDEVDALVRPTHTCFVWCELV